MIKLIRGQSAIEYLMAYGWMLLVVAVVGGAIFSIVEDQDIESVNGFNSNDIIVEDFGVSDGGLSFATQSPVSSSRIERIKITSSENKNASYILNQRIKQDEVIHIPGIRASDETQQLEVKMIYDYNDLENLTTEGNIQGSLVLEDQFADSETILEGLIGYWRMDKNVEGSGGTVHDYSGYGFEGVTRGDLESGVSGFSSNNAFRFDGLDDYVELTDTPDIFSGSEDFTIIAWANHRTVNTGTPQQIITPSPDNQFELREDGNGEVIFGWWDGSTFRHGLDFPVSADNWYQAAVTWDSDNNVSIYKNGSLKDSVLTDSSPTLSTGLATIGQKGGGSNFFDGRIGEVRIYNRSLSGSEVSSIYNRYQ